MVAYELEQWHELFVMVGGASAALAGLLFVAVSLNLDHVLKYGALPSLAAQAVSLLVAVVVASVLGLAPGQGGRIYGIELLVLGVVVAAIETVPPIRGLSQVPRHQLNWRLWLIGAGIAAAVPLLVGAISLIVGAGGGMYWILAWMVASLVVATYNAWVLLVEIRR